MYHSFKERYDPLKERYHPLKERYDPLIQVWQTPVPAHHHCADGQAPEEEKFQKDFSLISSEVVQDDVDGTFVRMIGGDTRSNFSSKWITVPLLLCSAPPTC